MKKLLLLLPLLLVLSLATRGQTIQSTPATPHTLGTPTHTPSTYGSHLVFDKTNGILYQRLSGAWVRAVGTVTDGDKGDITTSSSGTSWQLDASSVGNTEIASGAGGIYKGGGTIPASTRATIASSGVFEIDCGTTAQFRLGDVDGAGTDLKLLADQNSIGITDGSYNLEVNTQTNHVYAASPAVQIDLAATLGLTTITTAATGGWKITDSRATPRGLQYSADYSATYDDRSLVDKAYVVAQNSTNANLTGPVTSVGNATTITANSIDSTHISNGTISPNDFAQRGASVGQVMMYTANGWRPATPSSLTDGDKGDITVSGSGTNWQLDASSVGNTEIASGTGGIYKGSGTVPASTTATAASGLTITNSGTGTLVFGDPSSNRVEIGPTYGYLGGTQYSFTASSDDSRASVEGPKGSIEANNTGLSLQIGATATIGAIGDNRASPKGMEYSGDYSATYTDRSLVDKAYVVAQNSTNANLTGPVTSVGNATTITANSIDSTKVAASSLSPSDIGPSGASVGQVMTYTANGWRPATAGAGESVISPTQLTANTDNWNPSGLSTATVIRLSTDAIRNITGLTAPAEVWRLTIVNIGTKTAMLTGEDASSTAANRFAFYPDEPLLPGATITIIYDLTSARWRKLETLAGYSMGNLQTTYSLTPVDATTLPYGWAKFASGAGAGVTATYATSTVSRLFSIATGTTTTGHAQVRNADYYFYPSTSASVLCRQDIITPSALSDGTNTYTILVGIDDGSSTTTPSGFYLKYTHGTNSGKWLAVSRSGGTETTADTGVTVAASTTYTLSMQSRIDGSRSFWINGVFVGETTANAYTNIAAQTVNIVKSAGTTSRSIGVANVFISEIR